VAAVRRLGFAVRVFGPPNEEHLVVFIIVQNLVVIDAGVSIICMFLISRVWLENACSRCKIGLFFGGDLPPKWGAISTEPKRHILSGVRVVWAIMRENPSTGMTCR